MASSYPKLATAPQTIPGPRVSANSNAQPAKIQPLGDGRAMLHLGDLPAGIYASEAAAEAAITTFQRMGVAL